MDGLDGHRSNDEDEEDHCGDDNPGIDADGAGPRFWEFVCGCHDGVGWLYIEWDGEMFDLSRVVVYGIGVSEGLSLVLSLWEKEICLPLRGRSGTAL